MKKQVLRIMSSCLILLMFNACSNTRLAYNYLDWIITWKLNNYIKLNNQQEDFYKNRLEVLLKWHKNEQLQHYSIFLNELQQHINLPMTTQLFQDRYKTIQKFWKNINIKAEPDCSYLLLQLSPGQRKDFYASLLKQNKTFEVKFLNENKIKRKKRVCNRMQKILKRFIGRLSNPQKDIIKNWFNELIPMQSLWLKNRSHWQITFESILEGKLTNIAKREMLKQLIVYPEKLWSDNYRKAITNNETATLNLITKVNRSQTQKQKKHLYAKLEKLKNDFIHLSNH